MDTLGQFEQLVLTAILALGGNAYGVTIHVKVEELSKPRKVARGAVYATLDRMEDKRLIASWLSDPTPQRGGRSRRHYRLEKSGEKALREAANIAQRLIQTIVQELAAPKPVSRAIQGIVEELGGHAWKPRR